MVHTKTLSFLGRVWKIKFDPETLTTFESESVIFPGVTRYLRRSNLREEWLPLVYSLGIVLVSFCCCDKNTLTKSSGGGRGLF